MIIPYTLSKTGVQPSLVIHTGLYRGKNFNLHSGHCLFRFVDTNMVPKNVTPLIISAGTTMHAHSSHPIFTPEITQALHILSLLRKKKSGKGKGCDFPFKQENLYGVKCLIQQVVGILILKFH